MNRRAFLYGPISAALAEPLAGEVQQSAVPAEMPRIGVVWQVTEPPAGPLLRGRTYGWICARRENPILSSSDVTGTDSGCRSRLHPKRRKNMLEVLFNRLWPNTEDVCDVAARFPIGDPR